MCMHDNFVFSLGVLSQMWGKGEDRILSRCIYARENDRMTNCPYLSQTEGVSPQDMRLSVPERGRSLQTRMTWSL